MQDKSRAIFCTPSIERFLEERRGSFPLFGLNPAAVLIFSTQILGEMISVRGMALVHY